MGLPSSLPSFPTGQGGLGHQCGDVAVLRFGEIHHREFSRGALGEVARRLAHHCRDFDVALFSRQDSVASARMPTGASWSSSSPSRRGEAATKGLPRALFRDRDYFPDASLSCPRRNLDIAFRRRLGEEIARLGRLAGTGPQITGAEAFVIVNSIMRETLLGGQRLHQTAESTWTQHPVAAHIATTHHVGGKGRQLSPTWKHPDSGSDFRGPDRPELASPLADEDDDRCIGVGPATDRPLPTTSDAGSLSGTSELSLPADDDDTHLVISPTSDGPGNMDQDAPMPALTSFRGYNGRLSIPAVGLRAEELYEGVAAAQSMEFVKRCYICGRHTRSPLRLDDPDCGHIACSLQCLHRLHPRWLDLKYEILESQRLLPGASRTSLMATDRRPAA